MTIIYSNQTALLSWIKLLLNSQQSRVINEGNNTPYFNLENGAQ